MRRKGGVAQRELGELHAVFAEQLSGPDDDPGLRRRGARGGAIRGDERDVPQERPRRRALVRGRPRLDLPRDGPGVPRGDRLGKPPRPGEGADAGRPPRVLPLRGEDGGAGPAPRRRPRDAPADPRRGRAGLRGDRLRLPRAAGRERPSRAPCAGASRSTASVSVTIRRARSSRGSTSGSRRARRSRSSRPAAEGRARSRRSSPGFLSPDEGSRLARRRRPPRGEPSRPEARREARRAGAVPLPGDAGGERPLRPPGGVARRRPSRRSASAASRASSPRSPAGSTGRSSRPAGTSREARSSGSPSRGPSSPTRRSSSSTRRRARSTARRRAGSSTTSGRGSRGGR